MEENVRVLIVDDSPDVADAIARLIDRTPGMASVGSLHTAHDLTTEVLARKADVVLVDLTMPGSNPLEAVRRLTAQGALCRVVVMSGYDDAETVNAAVQAGATAFVSKHGDPARIVSAIRAAGAGGHGQVKTSAQETT